MQKKLKKKFKSNKIFSLFSKSEISVVFLFKKFSIYDRSSLRVSLANTNIVGGTLVRRVGSRYLKTCVLDNVYSKKYESLTSLLNGSLGSISKKCASTGVSDETQKILDCLKDSGYSVLLVKLKNTFYCYPSFNEKKYIRLFKFNKLLVSNFHNTFNNLRGA
jgi:hypothetical protein